MDTETTIFAGRHTLSRTHFYEPHGMIFVGQPCTSQERPVPVVQNSSSPPGLTESTTAEKETHMGKHHDKIQKALEKRISSMPSGKSGYRTPGSMNKKKTGYMGVRADGPK